MICEKKLKKTFIWGHRGAGAYEVDNTISSFRRAVEMGVDGVETDAHLSVDGEIILYHDFLIKHKGKRHEINRMTLKDIKEIVLEKDERIATLKEVFTEFKNLNIKYSIDLKGTNVGFKIIELAKSYNLLDKVVLVGNSFLDFSRIRKKDKEVEIIYSISERHAIITEKDLKLKKMKELDIQGFNIKNNQAKLKFFKLIKDQGLQFYVWGITTQRSIEKFLKMNYNDGIVDALYSDYPDKLLESRRKIQGV